jgi:hypothetical protein
VAHHGDAGPHHGGDRLGHLRRATLHLHGRGARLLEHASRITDRLLGGDLIGQEWEVDDDEPSLDASPHGPRMIDHVVERDRQRGIEAEDDVRERVTDENHVGAGAIHEAREKEVVGSKRSDALASTLHLLEIEHPNASLASPTLSGHGSVDVPAPELLGRSWQGSGAYLAHPSGKRRTARQSPYSTVC